MKQELYLTTAGKLKREQNTLVFIPSENNSSKKFIPIENVSDIYAFNSIEINSALITFLSANQVPIHFFNYYGIYTASLYPREENVSGLVIIKQAEHYLNQEKRIYLAKEMVKGILTNTIRVIRYYANRNRVKELDNAINTINVLLNELEQKSAIDEIRGIEGKSKDIYFSVWNHIISNKKQFKFDKRTRRPPSNPINALISFGNSLMYALTISQILHVHLHGSISYVHEPRQYRFSLALDIADIFKPVFVDRLIFKLINQNIIQEKHFSKHLEGIILTDSGKRTFLQHWDEMLKRTVKHPTLKRNVSMKQLVKLECYKIIKHILGEKPYKSFKIWWQ